MTSQTGTGKTAAFIYPILAKMLNDGPPPCKSGGSCLPLALILCPTHELTMQLYEETLKFSFKTGIRTQMACGGKSFYVQETSLRNGCDIVVATPGRLIDFIEKKVVNLGIVRYLVIDEADKMLDMGFESQIIRILTAIKKVDRETVMCSATFPGRIHSIAKKYLRDPVVLNIGNSRSANQNIKQVLHLVRVNDKPQLLVNLIKKLNGRTLSNFYLVFVVRKVTVDELSDFLYNNGICSLTLHGDKFQRDRDFAIRSFKDNENSILIATDIASRGLDINDIKQVIVYDFPNNAESYVHRIGRTGRNGNMGLAHIFVTDGPNLVYKAVLDIMSMSGQEIPEWFCELANGRNYFPNEMYENFNVKKEEKANESKYVIRKIGVEDLIQKKQTETPDERTQENRKVEVEKCEVFERRNEKVLTDIGNEQHSLPKRSDSINQKLQNFPQKLNSTQGNENSPNSNFSSYKIQKIPRSKNL